MSEAAQLKHTVADLRKEIDALHAERMQATRVIAELQNERFAKAAEADLAALRSGLGVIAQEMRAKAADDAFDNGPVATDVERWADRLSALSTIPRTD